MSTNQKNNEEEIDLGSLFVLIGKGFSKFFNFIGSIFKGIFNFLIIILIFFKQHFIKIAIAALVGVVAGVFLEVKKKDLYGSDLLVKPNFESTRQLYNNINYYNDLVRQKKTADLAEIFNLDEPTAASFKKFTITSVETENDIIDSYNKFILAVDTTTVKSYKYEQFKNAFSDYDYKIHEIHVVSEKNDVFNNLGDVIISSVVKNKYFNRLKELSNENLNRTDSLLRQNLGQVDSLRRVYMQVMVEEAKKQSNGTNIDLGGVKSTTKELELFDTNRRINAELRDVVNDRSEKYEVINVISNFQSVGYKVSGVAQNYAFLLAVLGAGLMVLFLMIKQLNTFLNNYKK
ncbi:hypothetical protein BTO15_04045 [Polaribacter sejongensis]|uniref:Polysaccharide chain length determinant N-terminal domain-containing protein n=1 Tax=Polaribacter sejongensis TaxID=985043 RepID=A0ABN5F560_9FLAO|nr:hypothetical protein [Polaribacter sejongensis]AUC21327.1 hypothetical protein BTO15_04045 [Polaribacter sejongensis]